MSTVFIVVVVLAGIAFIIAAWLMWRARARPMAAMPKTGRDGQSLWVRFRDNVRRRWAVIDRAVRYVLARRDWRYNSSWLLVLGFPGDGKSSIAASVPTAMQRAPQRRDARQEKFLSAAVANSSWYFLDQGILIDTHAVMPVPGPKSLADARWPDMLADLDTLRPDRAVDGIVWVISAARLFAASDDERLALGRYAYARVHELQDAIAYALPVYVVVSQCDVLPGFNAFWKAQDPALREQMIGWSSPTIDDNGLPSEWVPRAFDKVIDGMRALVLDAATTKDHIEDADGFFLFPQHMRSLQAPLLTFLEALFKPNVYDTRSFCRGLYFTGAPEPVAPGGGVRKDIAFVPELVGFKALAERRLAVRTQKGLLARNRLIRRLQLGCLAVAVALAVALPWSAAQVNRHAQILRDTVVNISVNSKVTEQPGCLDQARVYMLVEQVTSLNENTRYLAIPLSWVDRRINHGVADVVSTQALQEVVLPSLACHLQKKIDALTATTLNVSESMTEPSAAYRNDQDQLKAQLSELAVLEKNLQRFVNIAQPGAVEQRSLLLDFGALSEYVYGKPLPDKTLKVDSPLSDALLQATYADPPKVTPELRARLAQQFDRMAAQAQSDLLRRAGSGVSLLSSLQEGKPPVLDTLRSFNGWLDWVHGAWLLSTPEDNPCTRMGAEIAPGIQTLIRDHLYDPTLRATLDRFNATQCYQPALDGLRAASVAPYGALLVVNPTTHQLEGINPGLNREAAGLRALADVGYMQVKSPQPYHCNGAAGGWRPGTFDPLLSDLREYQMFASQQNISQLTPAADQPLYDRLARAQLDMALQDALARNLRTVVQPVDTGLDATSQIDRELATESADLAAALPPLMQAQQRMRQLGLNNLADEMGQCAQNYGSSMLLDVSGLASASHLYDPPGQSTEGDGSPLFDLGTTPVLQDYLDRQLQRVQVLARYAAPFVSLLKQTQGVNNTQRRNSQTDTYWSNTIAELNRAVQFADPAGQAAHLNDVFLKQLANLTAATCDSTWSTYVSAPVGNDLFSARRSAMESMGRAACANHGQAGIDLHYMRIGMLFNSQLAGRYPFGKADSRELSPGIVKGFFVYYAQEKPELVAQLAHAKGDRADRMKAFISQLDAAQTFFASNLLLTPQSGPVDVQVGFRAQAADSPVSNQLIAWTLTGGDQPPAAWPGTATTFTWHVGDPLSLDLQWADRSRFTPVADDAQPDLSVIGYHATFRVNGSWALLRIMDAYAAAGPANALDPDQKLLRFQVPVLDSQGSRTAADFYLTLKLGGSDAATHAPVSLAPPNFPREAPVLW
ncbi:type VI secretion system protein ImpL [Luteibacter sp. Sphag1AF]|uniref:type VI secretion system protein n=1 Tax=Luteibacter sp. Sphag1AF TaxID=2587031 RepID=UPI00161EC86A|nr:type VI secretion protein IcmF/TssM N-terminal domain-containing protein [Luteibacter sp. Sphag1AF]MBB3228076.1 type VI secretion system protein ImpL [Luteibacter sp. Sphag1AF]